MNSAEFYQNLPVLKTERLILRKLQGEDAGAYYEFASDPQVTRYLRWGPHASLRETEAYLGGVLDGYQQGIDGPWGIELAHEQRLIGTIHLMEIDPYHLKADVGVVLHSHFWRRGFGSEALQRTLAFCFEDVGLQRVQGLAITENEPACRMMAKCKMTHEGVRRHSALQKGRWWDFDLYAILAGGYSRD